MHCIQRASDAARLHGQGPVFHYWVLSGCARTGASGAAYRSRFFTCGCTCCAAGAVASVGAAVDDAAHKGTAPDAADLLPAITEAVCA